MPPIDYSKYNVSDRLPGVLAAGIVVGLLLGIILLVFFLPKRKREHYQERRGLLFLHDYLNFNIMAVGVISKLLYIIMTFTLVMLGLYWMFVVNFLYGLFIVVLGNVLLRVIYEFIMLQFSIHENLKTLVEHMTGASGASVSGDELMDELAGKVQRGARKGAKILLERQELRRRRREAEEDWYVEPYEGGEDDEPQDGADGEPSGDENGEPRGDAVFCPKCGRRAEPDSSFCMGCGYQFALR